MPPSSPQEPNEFEELEQQLRSLTPAPPKAHVERQIGRELDLLADHRRENRIVWIRFAPLAAAACLVLAGAGWFQHQLATTPVISASSADSAKSNIAQSATLSEEPAAAVSSSRPFVSPPPISTGIPAERFVPVSSQEYFRQASEGSVVELSGKVPARELRVEYDDAWHWHDPETQTNVRIFRPREEILLVPVTTD